MQHIKEYEPGLEKTCLLGFRPGQTQPRAVQPQKMANGMKFRIQEEEGLYYLHSENQGADQLCGNAQLICAFVLLYAKIRFSHGVSQRNQAPTKASNRAEIYKFQFADASCFQRAVLKLSINDSR